MNLSAAAARKLLETTIEAMLVVDSDGRIVFANPQLEQLFGFSRGELVGEQLELLLPEDSRAKHVGYRERYRGAPHARPLVSGLSLRGRRKDGSIFDAEISLTPVEDSDGTLVASTVRDISAGDTSEAYFRHLLQAAPDAMIIIDSNGLIAIANDQSERMFGYSSDQLLGQPIEMLLPESVRERHVQHRSKYIEEPRLRPMGSGMELLGRRADGATFPVEISLSPIRVSSGLFVSSVIRDVTARKDMESELIAARQAAERAHKANTAFLAAASHDLRQPVQALSLLNGALRRTVKDELAQEMVASQQHSLDAMTNLLNSLLDISRLDAGAIEPEIEDLPVQRLIDRLSAEFSRQARQKGLEFEAIPCAATIRSDANLLAEIIQNLVSNAVRYTESGHVRLTCREAGGKLHIDVGDTGIGIAAEHREDIFREFHQLRDGPESNEGFGLGLAIVRRLAELLAHEISVESEVGKGSCFTVTVPLAERQQAMPSRSVDSGAISETGQEALVLLIEDDRSVTQAWTLLLRAEGYRVVTAESADEALAAVRAGEESPQLIISDYHLKDGSTGVQAVAAVREHFSRDIPVFIVSGDTSKVVDGARQVSNSLLLAKPVNSDELLEKAAKVLASGNLRAEF